MCWLSWFLDPGGWSKTAVVGLYFIFPGICTLSLLDVLHYDLVISSDCLRNIKRLTIMETKEPYKEGEEGLVKVTGYTYNTYIFLWIYIDGYNLSSSTVGYVYMAVCGNTYDGKLQLHILLEYELTFNLVPQIHEMVLRLQTYSSVKTFSSNSAEIHFDEDSEVFSLRKLEISAEKLA
ncbi:hypothetical protein STEG23_017782, partial [Scotinomys teguina]